MNLVQKQKLDMKQAVNQIQKELPTMTGTEGATARRQMNNAVNEVDEEDVDEQTSTGGSSGAFVAPLGWDPEDGISTPLKEEEELDETGAASSGAYSQPAIWAKNYKNWKAVQDPKFPKYGGPGAKYVRIKEKCNHFPYCNQGETSALEFYEDKTLKEAIDNISKKTNKTKRY